MKKNVSSEAVRSLLALYEQGRQQSLWKNKSDCGRKIGLAPEDFQGQSNGYRPDAVIRETVEKLRKALAGGMRVPSIEKVASPSHSVIQELFERGCARGVWSSQHSCAEFLAIPRETLRGYIGESDPASRGPRFQEQAKRIAELMQSRVEGEVLPVKEESPSSPQRNSFRELFGQGCAQGVWSSKSTCARVLGIHRHSLRNYLKSGADLATMGPRSRKHAKKVLSAMRRKVAGEAVFPTREVPEPPPSPPPLRGETRARGAGELLSHALEGFGDHLATLLAGKLHAEMESGLRQIRTLLEQVLAVSRRAATEEREKPLEAAASPDVIPSQWADEVIAGRMELAGQNLPNVRFVLTAPPYKKLVTRFTAEEGADTVEFAQVLRIGITELRKRMTHIAQLAERRDRTEIVDIVGPELDALFLEFERSQDADLCASWKLREQQRQDLGALRRSVGRRE